MTSRKAKQRQPQPHAPNPVSDYDSDFNVPSPADAPLPPPTRTNTELNLSVLKRHLPDAISIVSLASFVVVYVFSPMTHQWEKNGMEGTLFICELSPIPSATERYAVFVLNRRGLDNFKLELLDSDDVDITEEYVILQEHNDEDAITAYGLWIFTEPEPSSTAHAKEVNAKIIEECALRAEKGRVPADREQRHFKGQGMGANTSQSSFREAKVQGTESTGLMNMQRSTSHSHQPKRIDGTQPPDVLGELFRKATQSYRGSS